MYSYHGLGATGNDNDKSKKEDNTIFWSIITALSGLIVFEFAISNKGYSYRIQSKKR